MAAHYTHASETTSLEQNKVYVKHYARGGEWKWVPGNIVICTVHYPLKK